MSALVPVAGLLAVYLSGSILLSHLMTKQNKHKK
jgi:hypothetical protein